MKRFLRVLTGLLAGGLLVLSACQMENSALDEPLTAAEASPLAKMSYASWGGDNYQNLGLAGVTVTACCGQPHAASGDSDAASGIDNLNPYKKSTNSLYYKELWQKQGNPLG
ncbi:MAG: hypothetical protein LBQ57_10690 [Spirochaetales bacterium]|jgi:hypothetical protein|nr:hypothetical protein [Spirochaetales bacterium]